MTSRPAEPDRWTHRLGVWTVLCAVPLVLFGGSVTTLGAGMAVEGWLIAEGHFLLLFPVESWLRDTATFVEHTHRLFAVLVGMVAIAACVRAAIAKRAGRPVSVLVPIAALVAVCSQGSLGGFRVLEDSPHLAFLHGVFAQVTFAILAGAAVYASAARAEALRTQATPATRRVLALGAIATLIVFAQVALGAWYRHGLRPEPAADSELRLVLHFAGAGLAFFAVTLLASAAKRAARELGSMPNPSMGALALGARRLHLLLGVQILLGLAAWAGFRPSVIGPAEWLLSISHVLVGALLLSQCAALLVLARACPAAVTRSAPEAVLGREPLLEGAR